MGLNPDQKKVVDTREGQICLISGPGTGKTTTLIARYDALVNSGVRKNEILSATFSREAAKTMTTRGGSGNFKTFHSYGYSVLTAEKGKLPLEPELRHRLMFKLVKMLNCDYKLLDRFISKMRHRNITPEMAMDEVNSGNLPYQYAKAYYLYEIERKQAGWIDFDCQPPETLVTVILQKPTTARPMVTTQKKISELMVGDTLLTWQRRRQLLKTYGRKLNGVTSRQYKGRMLTVQCGEEKTKATPNHYFWARFNSKASNKYAIYIMYRSDLGFRIGQCKFLSSTGYSNWKARLAHQKAEKMWILTVTENAYEALTLEAEISVRYGIPQTVFEPCRDYPTIEAIRRIFAAADSERGFKCLFDFGREFEFPIVSSGKMVQWIRQSGKNGKCLGGYQRFRASNLLPEIMSLPGNSPMEERPITSITQEQYNGLVYSLDVDVDHTYIADGIPVGNCMIVDAVALLEQPEVRARHQWKYVMADECQDTDDVQFRLLQLITEKYGNVMCVGDPGQSIYQFRGAKPENMTNFRQWFPRGEYLYLGMNYRSTQTITDFVREYYPLNIPLKEKIVAARAETGVPISYRMFMSENDEAESAVVRSIADPTNSIILARTNRMLGLVENFCLAHDIKYHLLGKSGFWKQSEIIRAVDKLKSYAFLQTSAAMEKVMPELERHYQAEDATPEDNFALENIRQMREFSKKFPVCKDFIMFANRVRHAKPKTTGITLSTIHQAKGTEFKHVTVIGARMDMIPHVKGDDEEEKRIFLVAISRAIDDLTLSFVGTPSSYLKRKLNDDVMQELRERAGDVERFKIQNVLFS